MTTEEDDAPAPLVGVSASQIETFAGSDGGCERKWGWDKIAGEKQPENEAARDGQKIHTILEGYLQTGVIDHSDPRLGAIASSGTHLLPAVIHEVEGRFRFHSPTNPLIVYRGRKDFGVHPYVWNGSLWVQARPRPLIGDHKSTKSISSWAKSTRVLCTDVQVILYAKSELDRWAPFGVNEIDGLWVYYETGAVRRAEPRRFTLTADEIEKSFQKIELTAAKIASIVQASRAHDTTPEHKRLRVLSLAYNTRSCEKFGGCPYQGKCNLSPQERLSASFAQFTQGSQMQQGFPPAPPGYAQQFAGMPPGPVPVHAPPPPPPAPPAWDGVHAPSGAPLPRETVDTGMVFDPGSNNYYNVREIIASHGLAAIAPLLEAAAVRHAASGPAAPPPAPPPPPAGAGSPVPSFLGNFAINPPEGAAPPVQPPPPPMTAPPVAEAPHEEADEPKGKAAIQAKIDAEVLAGTFVAAPQYAKDPAKKGKRSNAEIEQDLRWQKTQALGLTHAIAPGAQPPPAPAPTPFAPTPAPIVAQADRPLTGWLEDFKKYSALAANALAQHLSGSVKP